MENYQKALNYAIEVFNITSNEDDDILMKSHTMSMAMFKSADHLPFIVGSKAYGQDEYLGIIDRHEKDTKYLRGVGEEAPAAEQSSNENTNMSPASGALSVTNFRPEIPGASNLTEIRNTTLGPPPSLESLLSGAGSGSSEARNEGAAGPRPGMGLMGEISARGNLMNEINARGNMMNEINARGNMLNEIAARGQAQGEAPAGGRANLMAEINARGNMMNEINARGNMLNEINARGNLMDEIAGRGRMQTEAPAAGGRANLMNEINARGNLMNEIANRGRLQTDAGRGSANPMFQAIAQPQAKSNKLFDDDEEDVEIGNADMFKSSSTNKKKFENLLGNPMPMGTSSMGNPLGLPGLGGSNPLGINPFDPYASMNPFMPFQPKSEQAQAAAQKPEPKLGGNPMMSLASEIKAAAASRGGEDNEEKDVRASKANKLNKLFEDSDEDEEARLNKQKELSQKYRGETKVTAMEERAAPISTQKPNARVSKLFDDEEEDLGFATRKNTAPIKKDMGLGKSTAAKKKMFDDDDEIKEEDESPIKKAPAKKIDEDDDLADSQARRSKTMAGAKPAKATLFDDDDDDAPIGGRQSKAPAKIEPKKKDKKTLFDDDDEDDVGFSAKKDTKPAAIPAKKTLFDDDGEAEPVVVQKPKPQPVIQEEPKPVIREEPKPIIREEPKPIVREEPKVEVIVPEVKREEVIRKPEPEPVVEKKETAPAEDENRGVRAATSTNLTQLIKASQLNRKKKHFGGSSEEDSDSDGSDAAPVRKPQVKAQPPVIQEVIPEVKKEEEIIRQPEPEPVVVETKVEEPVPVVEVKAEEEPKPVVEEKPKNISSKISALQNQLNLNMDMFKPGGEGPPRKPKASIQPDESIERKEENLAPGQLSHSAAMAKPKQQARAKKTIMFDDDDEEDKKPADPFVSKTYVAPKVEPVQPVQQYTPPVQQQPAYEEPPAFRPSTTTTKKVAWKDDDEEEQTNTRPSYTNTTQTQVQPQRASTTSGGDNPMALLSGLKALDSKSGRASTKKAIYDDDDEEEQPKPAARPSNLGMASGGDNPLALLSNLQAMDAEKGRKSNKGKKGKGIFDDDEDDIGFAPKKVEEPRKSTATQGRQSSKMNTLFDDSDEDKNQSWGRKSEAPAKTQSKAANNRKTLFDDDD